MTTSSLPIAIQPIHATREPNEILRLYDGPIEIIVDERALPGHGIIEQRWQPQPHVFLDCQYESHEMLKNRKAQLVFPGHSTRYDVFLRSYGLGVEGKKVFGTLKGKPEQLTWGLTTNIRTLTFHVPNFSWCHADLVHDTVTGETREARSLSVSVDGWTINIDSVLSFSLKAEDDLEKVSGNSITHVGVLERKDGATFLITDAQAVLQALRFWLSFCRGGWVAPILSVGFDNTGTRVWNDWSQWDYRSCEILDTWVNRNNSVSLNQTFPGYYARYKDEFWGSPIRSALSWYVECNRRASGLEASIILCQTALELLGWVSLVEDKKLISQKGFDTLPASDKVRLLLSSYKIPLEVPVYLADLERLGKAYSWRDGPECLTGIRNALIHPQLKNREKIEKISPLAFYEVWGLGLWYLDLIFLNLFGCMTLYRNRLKRNCTYDETLELVPWCHAGTKTP